MRTLNPEGIRTTRKQENIKQSLSKMTLKQTTRDPEEAEKTARNKRKAQTVAQKKTKTKA